LLTVFIEEKACGVKRNGASDRVSVNNLSLDSSPGIEFILFSEGLQHRECMRRGMLLPVKEGKLMAKIDLKKALKEFYNPSLGQISAVDVPAMNFIMIDGAGDPNKSQEYQDAIEALYSISYPIKFMVKKEKSVDYGVMPLEGLWWTDDMAQFSQDNKGIWKWTAMIMQPEYVSEEMFERAREQAFKKKGLASLSKTRFQSFSEGLSVQTMYIGLFAEEGPTIEKLHKYIKEKGYIIDGTLQKHHEIYLSDFRRTAPEKFKSIIRQPMAKR
jgi:hypothetical protein